ncbi:MAG: DUF4358 domain-containing protein [Dorea sp.]|jgi:hypothetical protein|nr:DUF4358 domain-containing protein [Dorea sp.]
MKNLMKGIVGVKYVLIILLFIFIAGLLSSGEISDAKLENVTEKVVKEVGTEKLSAADNRMVKRLFGINANDYEGVSLYVAGSNMEVEELLIVKLKDTVQSESVEAAIQGRLERQLESFEGYGPEQCKLLNDHVLDVKGNYILYVVDKKAKAADQAFQKSL